MEGFGKAAENLALILRDACGIIINPLKSITQGSADRLNKKKELLQKFELEKIELVERAKLRIQQQEIRRQYNLEAIGRESVKHLPPVSIPEKVEIDWLHFFMDSCKDVSDETIRIIWAKILANETLPNSHTSKSTLEVLKKFSKEDCIKFEKLSEYILRLDIKGYALLFRDETKQEFDFFENLDMDDIYHFEYLGLLSSRKIDWAMYDTEQSETQIDYEEIAFNDSESKIIIKRKEGVKIAKIPIYKMTKAGYELVKSIGNRLNESYLNSLFEYLDNNGINYKLVRKE